MTTQSASPPIGESNADDLSASPKKQSRKPLFIVAGLFVFAVSAFAIGLRYYFFPRADLPAFSSLLPFFNEDSEKHSDEDLPNAQESILRQPVERKEPEPDGAERYAEALEARIKEKEAALYAMRSKRRDAEAEAERLAAERDEATGLALRVDAAHAFLASGIPKERARYAREISEFSSDVADVAKREGSLLTDGELRNEFIALYDAENERNAYVVSWSFLPEFMQKYARRWLFVQKIRGNRWKETRDALEGGDAVRLASAMRAAQAEGDPGFNAWAKRWAAQANMRRAVETELSKWRAELGEIAALRKEESNQPSVIRYKSP